MKKIIQLPLFILFSLMLLELSRFDAYALQIAPINSFESITDNAVPCKEFIEWRYKIKDGVMYKRQFNMTTGKWLGRWEIVK